jgi:hypothetical protein
MKYCNHQIHHRHYDKTNWESNPAYPHRRHGHYHLNIRGQLKVTYFPET